MMLATSPPTETTELIQFGLSNPMHHYLTEAFMLKASMDVLDLWISPFLHLFLHYKILNA